MTKRKKVEKPYRAGSLSSSRFDAYFESLQNAKRHIERIDDGKDTFYIFKDGKRILMYSHGTWYKKGELLW